MKWLGRVLYIVMIFFVGLFVLALNNNKQLAKYYDEYAQKELDENNREKYMEHFMTSKLVKEYLKDPIYVANSDDDKFPFELAIYHAKVNVSKDDTKDYLILYLNENGIDFENILEDYESFEKNGNNALMLAKLKIDGVKEEFNIPININKEDRTALHLIEVTQDDNKNDIFSVQYKDEDGKTLQEQSSKIEYINLSILDGTLGTKEEEIIETVFARFENDKNANMDSVDSFEIKDYTLPKKNDEDEEVVIEVLTAKSFNGEVEKYALSDKYEDENNLGVFHEELLEPFLTKAKNSLYWYVLIVILVTYLIFFLKPTIEYFKNKNIGTTQTEEVSNEVHDSDDFKSFKMIDSKDEVEVIEDEEVEEETVEDEVKEENISFNYNNMTVKELRELAKERKLTGYSSLNKKDLINFIKENE